MIVQIFVAQTRSIELLTYKLGNRVLNRAFMAVIFKTTGESLQNPGPSLDFPQEQTPSVAGDGSSVKTPHYFPAF